MSEYSEKLLLDLPQQFKGKEKIEALLEVIGGQFDQLKEFYDSLNLNRALSTSLGVQLDRIGEILVLTREDAGKMFNKTEIISDDLYRQLLIYKSIMNFGSATYFDIMNCIKVLQGDNGFFYTEDPEIPATIILESAESAASKNVQQMLKTPIPKAAGVGLRIRANDGAVIRFGVGFTSQIMISKEIKVEKIDVDGLIIYYTDEVLDILVDENGEIILAEESIEVK